MKWYRVPISIDVIRSMCSLMALNERARADLKYSLGRGYHLYIRDDCKYFIDRAVTCPVKCSDISLDQLNILLLDRVLKD